MTTAPKPQRAPKPKPPPAKPGIYPVRYVTDERMVFATCAKWDGKSWRLWVEMFDPPEWDLAGHCNCMVIDWMEPAAPWKPLPESPAVRRVLRAAKLVSANRWLGEFRTKRSSWDDHEELRSALDALSPPVRGGRGRR